MTFTRLFVFVEGNDDDRFCRNIVYPALSAKYDCVKVWMYSQEPPKRIRNFLRAIEAMGADYLFLTDINNSPCVSGRIESTRARYGPRVEPERLVIVVKEIESWYLAGLDDKACEQLGTTAIRRTDDVTKEQFNKWMPGRYDSRIDFMVEILKRFSVETAEAKNDSFRYFMTKI